MDTQHLTPKRASAQVPPELAVRKLDRCDFVTVRGLSPIPGERPPESEIAFCLFWIATFCKPRKSINHASGWSSYELKHRIEESNPRIYVSEGSFIEAALRLGYCFEGIGYGSGAYFNMSRR